MRRDKFEHPTKRVNEMWQPDFMRFTHRRRARLSVHRSMKSVVKLNTLFFPSELEQALADFVVYYNTQPYHQKNGYPVDTFAVLDVFRCHQ